MSNFLCVEAYFAVLKWRFLLKIKWLSRTAVSQFSHLRTYHPRPWWLCFEMIASKQNVASHQSHAHRILFVTANRLNQ